MILMKKNRALTWSGICVESSPQSLFISFSISGEPIIELASAKDPRTTCSWWSHLREKATIGFSIKNLQFPSPRIRLGLYDLKSQNNKISCATAVADSDFTEIYVVHHSSCPSQGYIENNRNDPAINVLSNYHQYASHNWKITSPK